MTPERLATLHARSFDDAPRPWTADEFRELLDSPGCRLITRDPGFALVRIVGEEAEVLTLAVPPEARRRGLGRTLLAALEAEAMQAGVTEVFLEVAETNTAARGLYAKAGYGEAGWRKDYYGGPQHRRIAALVLRKAVGSPD